MTQTYYALYTIENRKEILQGVVNHREMVQLLPIFSKGRSQKIPRNFYIPITKDCAQRMKQSQVSKLDKLLMV
jgi:hypothetical protein